MSTTRNFLTGKLPPGVVDMTPSLPGDLILPEFQWCDPADIPRLHWLLGHWFLRGAVTLLAAAGGTGKTSLIVAIMLSLASGRATLRKPVYNGPYRVALWGLEDDLEQLSRQIAAASIAHEISQDDCGDRLLVLSALGGMGLEPMPLITATQVNGEFRLCEDKYQAIEDALWRQAVDVLIVDPFVSSHHARENDTEVIDRIVKRWSLVAKRTNCSIVLVHHTRKTNGEKADIDSVRGSIAGVNAARAVLLINRMTTDEAAAFGLPDDERRRMFSVDLGKANRSAPEAIEWYRLESISLGNGHGEPDDEIGAVVPWVPPVPHADLSRFELELAQSAIGNGVHRYDVRSPRWAGFAIGSALGIDARSADGKERLGLLIRCWIEEGKLVKVRRRDPSASKPFDHIELGPVDWFGGVS